MLRTLLTRILVDGAVLTVLVAAVAVGILYFNPRLALSDYPSDVKAAVPPRTKKEFRLGLLIAVPLLVISVGVPLHSVWLVKQHSGGVLGFWAAFATIAGEYLLFSIFDLIVLDIWMFFTWTPRFLVLPGTEGMAGYKNWRPHARAQLLQGNAVLAAAAAVLAFIAVHLL
jgi:hypothetical protein